jgi:CRISPR/Cas system CSM-associated protein Csm2 small subunit
MNTIQITTIDGAINYTESEVIRYIEKAGQVDNLYKDINTIRNTIRDFFSEREWSDRETTVNLDEVNELLNSIGSHSIQSTYSGNITISVSFSDLNADTADDAIALIEDEITVDLYSASISVNGVQVDDIEEE